MKTLASILFLAAALTLGDTAVGHWLGSNVAQAQGSSACFQNCTNVRRWPAAQCRSYCGYRSAYSGAYGYSSGMGTSGSFGAATVKAAPSGPGMCGTYLYWKDGKCNDARTK